MQYAILTENLTKDYGGKRGVRDLNLEVAPGEVFGYLGPNGAGKTTTIRQLLGFIRPTSGRAEVLGLDAQTHSVAIHRRVGYLPGELALYDTMTGREQLAYFAHLRGGVEPQIINGLAERLLMDLSRPIRTLSKGNKQKIGLIQAFMHQPEVLILDEPTSGLDPLLQQEFITMVREVKAKGCTVFLSSHVLAEVEGLADRVAIIREGQLITVEAMHTIKAKALRRLEIDFATAVPAEVFRALPGLRDLVVEDHKVRCTTEGAVDGLIKAAARFEVVNITSHEPDLEETFLAYYTAEEHHAH